MTALVRTTKKIYRFDHTAANANEFTGNIISSRRFRSFQNPYVAQIVAANLGTAPTSPTVDCAIESSLDGTNWISHGSFSQLTAAGTGELQITDQMGPFIRANVTTTYGTVNGGLEVSVYLTG